MIRLGGALQIATGVCLLAALPSRALSADISFNSDVEPILNRHCVICHMPGSEQGNLSLYPDSYGTLVDIGSGQSSQKLVDPGLPEQSYLYRKLMGTQAGAGGSGARMPFQAGPLAGSKIETIRLWIEQGANNN